MLAAGDDVEAGRGGLRHANRRRDRAGRAAGIFCGDIVVEQFAEGGGELVVGALEGDGFFAVNIDGATGLLAGAGKADADIGSAGFAGAIDDAAHYGELQFLDAFVLRFPLRHFVANVLLGALG